MFCYFVSCIYLPIYVIIILKLALEVLTNIENFRLHNVVKKLSILRM
jgi:hypothetical protein